MAEIDGGALSFKSVMDNDQINTAIEETLRRVQGLSDGTVAGGKKMDAAFDATADNIRNALGQIGTACEMHEKELQNLESEYQRLGQKASAAFMAGRDEEYNAITNQQTAIKGEITVREKLLQELRDQSNELEKVAQKQDENRQKTEENANAQVSMRSRIKALREEMMLLVDQGIDEQSDAYQRLKNELGRLIDIQGDVTQQGRTLANDEQKFQGIITGLSGLAGGFSAVTGAVSLFAGENEDLNKVMTKVQSVMAITIGLQQVAQTLNKDSAFQLVTMNSLKEWWRNVVVQATVAETAETVATGANTVAKEANAAATGESAAAETLDTAGKAANTVAATTGTVANLTLAGAFRAVGAAIMSIPVFGWIIAGITALAAGIYALTSKQREAKKAQEEFTKSVVDGAYKSIGSVQFLSQQWKALGDDMDAKKKFIEQNKKAFDELGVSILDVADAEKLLNSGTKNFIDAQIAKAKAAALLKNSEDLVKQSIEADQELKEAKKTPKITRNVSSGVYGANYSYTIDNPAIKEAQEKQTEANTKLRGLYAQAAVYEKEGADLMTKVGIAATKKYATGTVGAIEQAIDAKKKALDGLKGDNKAYLKTTQDIEKLQKQLDKLTGKKEKTTNEKTKDPFLEKLEKQKAEYTRFLKWVNSGDAVISKAANKEFAGILKDGATYMDYLKRQRDQIMKTPENKRTSGQQKQLTTINNQIAEETQKTDIDLFNTQLTNSLKGADTILAKLQKIADMRKELKNDGTELDNSKKEKLDDAEKDVVQQVGDDYKKSLDDYKAYQLDRLKEDERYLKQKSDLEKQLAEATDPTQKKVIKTQLDTLNVKQNERSLQNYDKLLEQYKTYQQQKEDLSKKFDGEISLAEKNNNATLVELLKKDKLDALQAISNSQLEIISKDNTLLSALFGKVGEMSKKSAKEAVVNAEKLLSYLKGDSKFDLEFISQKQADELKESPNSIINIQEATDKLKDSLGGNDDVYMFSGVVKGLKKMKYAQEQYAESEKQTDEKLKKYYKNKGDVARETGLQSIVTSAMDAIPLVNSLADAMERLGDSTQSSKLKDSAAQMKSISEIGQSIGSGAKSGGWIGAIIGGASSIINQLFESFQTAESEEYELRQNRLDFLNEYNLMLLKVNETSDKVFGSDNTKNVVDAYKKAQDALAEYNIALNDTSNVVSSDKWINSYGNPLGFISNKLATLTKGAGDLFAQKDNLISTLKKSYAKGYTDLQAMAVKTKDYSAFANFFGKQDKYTSLKDLAPQLWDSSGNFDVEAAEAFLNTNTQISDEQRKQIQNVIDLKNSYDDAMDTVDEEIKDTFGGLYDSLSNALIDAVNNGTDAWSSFKDAGFDVLEDLGKKLMMELFFNDKFEALKTQLEGAYSSGDAKSIADAQASILSKFYTGIQASMTDAEAFMSDWNSKMNNYGFSSQEKDNNNTLTGAVKGVSEETASMIGGQMNAMRINQLEATAILRQQLMQLATIAQNTSYNVNLLDIRNDIRDMKNSGNSLRSQGLS